MRILFLSTWFPYPLSQGCKIRAYYLLRALAECHEVNVVTFEDAPVEPAWLDEIGKAGVRQIEIVKRDPFAHSRVKSLLGWFSPLPSAVLASYSPAMLDKVQRAARQWQPERVVALTFVTAPYAAALRAIPKVIDVDNLMSRMMLEATQAARKSIRRAPRHCIRRARSWLAWRKFAGYERSLYRKFNRCLVVSTGDQQSLREMLAVEKERVCVTPNGVDMTTHRPGLCDPEPNSLIFNGALTYAANYQAMQYFLGEIYPAIRAQLPGVCLRITGSTRGVPLEHLPSTSGVQLTGYLDDIRPAVAGSWACVVPLQEGGGTRLKILEAMALGTPVVSTSKGAEGLEVEHEKHLLIADDPGEFAAQTLRILNDAVLRQTLAENAFQLVREKYDWRQIGRNFRSLVEDLAPGN